MKKIFLVCCIFFSIFIVGCASIVSRSNYPVTFNSDTDAHLTIRDDEGTTYYDGSTPTTITLEASQGFFQPASYTARYVTKNDTVIRKLSANLDPFYLGNIIFGGLIGILIVDPATGAMWMLEQKVYLNPGPHRIDTSNSEIEKDMTEF